MAPDVFIERDGKIYTNCTYLLYEMQQNTNVTML